MIGASVAPLKAGASLREVPDSGAIKEAVDLKKLVDPNFIPG